MKLLLDKDGHAVIRNGKPVYVQEDNTEIEFDVVGTQQSIARLNSESAARRIELKAATDKLAVFGDIDPVKAKESLELTSKLDAKKLRDAGEVDAATALLNKGWEEKVSAEKQRAEKLEQQLIQAEIGGNFSRSKFISEKMVVPPDMVQASFGKFFKLVDGKVIASDANGQPIHSKANPAEVAGFDEALEIIVGNYAHRDSLLKATQKGGGGSDKGGGAGGQKNTLTRTEFGQKTPADQHKFIREGGKVVDTHQAA
jgi:hypothetical protein